MIKTYSRVLKMGFNANWYKLPNILTEIRLLGSPIPGVILLFGPDTDANRWLANVIFMFLASTDLFDGLSARILNQSTEYGRLLDPIADSFFGFFTLFALCVINPMAWVLIILVCLRQLHIIRLFSLATKRNVAISTVLSGKFKTVAVIIAVIFLLMPQKVVSYEIVSGIVAIACMFTGISWIDYYKQYSSAL